MGGADRRATGLALDAGVGGGAVCSGGLASYPSSVLMNAIPAQVAGVGRLVICCPTPDGVVNPLVLLAARISGVTEVYRIGGAQAIAALAYGTETIAPVVMWTDRHQGQRRSSTARAPFFNVNTP